jgi:5-methylcytosine-specific restriction endonuclease McrA
MPSIPTNPKCSTLGCKQPRTKFSGLCLEHGGRDTYNHKRYNQTEHRKDAADKYNSKQWRTLRQIQLSQYPICAGCKADGIITSASHVDHIFPWSHIGEHAFTHNIYQSLCPACHTNKTQLEQQGIYRRYGYRDYKAEEYRIVVANTEKILET